MEVVEAAGPSLAYDVFRLVRGEPVKDKVRRRSALALAKYHLRMSSRSGSSRVSRPRGWGIPWNCGSATSAVRPVGRMPVLVADNVSFVRGDRLVLTERYEDAHRREATIRYTPLVCAVRDAAGTPIPWPDLVETLCRRFRRTGFDGVLRQLVEIGVLLTDLDPPPDCVDPLEHVLDRLPAGHPVHEELRDTSDLIQTDLRLDVEATLPREVGAEAARARRSSVATGDCRRSVLVGRLS